MNNEQKVIEVEPEITNATDDKKTKERNAAKLRKRAERQRRKEAEQAEKVATFSNEQWFADNRGKLNKAERAAYDQREGVVVEIMGQMEQVIAGQADATRQLLDWVKADVAEHGTVYWNLEYVEKIATKQHMLAQWQSSQEHGATAVLIKYGYCIAIDNQTLIDFQNTPQVGKEQKQ